MPQYQSFPDIPGSSLTLQKLQALHIPPLAGKTFLDVGCNEGFFCGYAQFFGATRSVGIDKQPEFIQRAKARFPDCFFYCQDWENLPPGPFDVILIASALHYAASQRTLIHKLMQHLSENGTLVLELGIAESPENTWVKVNRGIDERFFPTSMKLKEILKPYAWRYIGPSIKQKGDPVSRHVFHVNKKKPVAFLLLQPSGYGKTTIAEMAFGHSGMHRVSLDNMISDIAHGRIEAPAILSEIIRETFSPKTIDQSINAIFTRNHGGLLAELIFNNAVGTDFILDGFVPREHHQKIQNFLKRKGYVCVTLKWERFREKPLPLQTIQDRATRFFESLSSCSARETDQKSEFIKGHVDDVAYVCSKLVFTGWAANQNGHVPGFFQVRLRGESHVVRHFEVLSRREVRNQNIWVKTPLCGFRFAVPFSGNPAQLSPGEDLRVYAGNTEQQTTWELIITRTNMPAYEHQEQTRNFPPVKDRPRNAGDKSEIFANNDASTGKPNRNCGSQVQQGAIRVKI
ncbi:MAG: class I SAM-dependent methyltransferase [Desulfovibrionales bacterium]|nr:MAG: class I SAM-dependent methyltransferase [Desulfovibrionales bacterium]